MLFANMSHNVPLHIGRHHFFEATSFRMALSSMVSASSFFSLAFSSSKAFSLRASDISMPPNRSEEHTSELQSLMRISYAVFCLKKKTTKKTQRQNTKQHHI